MDNDSEELNEDETGEGDFVIYTVAVSEIVSLSSGRGVDGMDSQNAVEEGCFLLNNE